MTQPNISDAEAEVIRQRFFDKIREMDNAELAIANQSEESFIAFVLEIIAGIAGVLGYTIGAVAGIVIGAAESFSKGAAAGWKAGFNAGKGRKGPVI